MSSNKKRRQCQYVMEQDSDENFAFIAGYTSGGLPYGITWEEMEEIEKKEQARQMDDVLDNEERLPFD